MKENTLGDAYPHVDFQDAADLEHLAWAVYDGIFVPGWAPDLSGYQDWDHIVTVTLIPLIYQGETNNWRSYLPQLRHRHHHNTWVK